MSTVVNDLQSVPQTFSSWDSCMSKAYCKWPVIAGIIIASLIVLSVVWCIASCLCCGATLCGSCVRCLTCFGCCGMCKTGSGGGGGRRTKYKDDYNQMPPTPYTGYQPPPAPMSYSRAPPAAQFATFDTSSKGATVNEDALPEMPTWATAASRRVEDHSAPPGRQGDDLEMGRMATTPRPVRAGYSQLPPNGPNSPLSPGPISPESYPGYATGQSHPYQSDLSAQRMTPAQPTYDNGYATTPMSPAPTYTTHPVGQIAGGVVATDQFARHAPTPSEYTRQQRQQPQYVQHDEEHYDHAYDQGYSHAQQYTAPQQYGIVHNSTPYSQPHADRHEIADYSSSRPQSISPPPNEQYENRGHEQIPHQHQRQSSLNQGGRPPSLLQVGRKPVNGTQREI